MIINCREQLSLSCQVHSIEGGYCAEKQSPPMSVIKNGTIQIVELDSTRQAAGCETCKGAGCVECRSSNNEVIDLDKSQLDDGDKMNFRLLDLERHDGTLIVFWWVLVAVMAGIIPFVDLASALAGNEILPEFTVQSSWSVMLFLATCSFTALGISDLDITHQHRRSAIVIFIFSLRVLIAAVGYKQVCPMLLIALKLCVTFCFRDGYIRSLLSRSS